MFLSVALFCATLGSANVALASDSDDIAELKAQLAELTERVDQAEKKAERKEKLDYYLPQIFGAIMAYSSTSTYNGDTRFNVRYSRFGMRGKVSDNVSYVSQVDFHAQGNLTVLDAYIKFAKSGFDLIMGQQLVHFNSNIDRGPYSCLFMSRSLGATYLMNYPMYSDDGTYSSKFLGARDMGVTATYSFKIKEVPMLVGVGTFSGEGINNPTWVGFGKMNYFARLNVGGKQGFYGAASYYWGDTPASQKVHIYNAELHYKKDRIFFETLYVQRRLWDNADGSYSCFQAITAQGYYDFMTEKSRWFKSISPTMRVDWADGINYQDTHTLEVSPIMATRISSAVNFAMKGEKLRSRFAVGYEKVFTDVELTDFDTNYLLCDRITVGFTVAF